MSDLISRQAVIKAIYDNKDRLNIAQAIRELPPVNLMYEQVEPREVVNVLEEIIQYTYGMITAEKFGLQQFLISKLDKYNSKLYDEKGET